MWPQSSSGRWHAIRRIVPAPQPNSATSFVRFSAIAVSPSTRWPVRPTWAWSAANRPSPGLFVRIPRPRPRHPRRNTDPPSPPDHWSPAAASSTCFALADGGDWSSSTLPRGSARARWRRSGARNSRAAASRSRYVLTSLIDEIHQKDDRIAVVIDDWHRVSDARTIAALGFLLDNGCHHLQ